MSERGRILVQSSLSLEIVTSCFVLTYKSIDHDIQTIISDYETRILSHSEEKATEVLKNMEELFLGFYMQFYMHSDVCSRSKYFTIFQEFLVILKRNEKYSNMFIGSTCKVIYVSGSNI